MSRVLDERGRIFGKVNVVDLLVLVVVVALVVFAVTRTTGAGGGSETTLPVRVTFTLQTQSTYNWEAASDQRWTVPINFLVSKLTKLGPFPFSIQAGGGYYAAHPDAGPKWRMQLAFILLLPAAK